MRTSWVRVTLRAVVALWCTSLFAAAHSTDDLRLEIESSPDGSREIWISRQHGLFLIESGSAGRRTLLGDGYAPRFAADGRLVFERGEDDGHHMIRSQTLVVDPGATVPRTPHAGEALPDWRPGVPAPGAADAPIKICIDPGHGGSDPGALGFGLREADIVLDVALRLRLLLNADTHDTKGGGEWDLLMTRTSDVTVSLSTRTTLANAFGAASFSSIHANAFTSPAANGTETYCFAEGTTAAQLRDRIHNMMLEFWQLRDRGTEDGQLLRAGQYGHAGVTLGAGLHDLADRHPQACGSEGAAEGGSGTPVRDPAAPRVCGLQPVVGRVIRNPVLRSPDHLTPTR